MKTRILTILAIVFMLGIFSACAEEEILPTDQQQSSGSAGGVADDDQGNLKD